MRLSPISRIPLGTSVLRYFFGLPLSGYRACVVLPAITVSTIVLPIGTRPGTRSYEEPDPNDLKPIAARPAPTA